MFSSLQKSNTRLGDKREPRLFPHSRRKLQISAPIEKKTLGKAPLFTPGTAEKLAVSLIAFTTGSSAMSRQWLTRVTHHYWNEKQVYFFLLQLYLNASQFLRASGSGTAGETPVSPVGKKGGETVKQQFVFCWLQALHRRRVSSFRRGRGGRAARRCAASLWLPLIDAPPAATLHSGAPARGQQAVSPQIAALCHPSPGAVSTNGKACRQNSSLSVSFFFLQGLNNEWKFASLCREAP